MKNTIAIFTILVITSCGNIFKKEASIAKEFEINFQILPNSKYIINLESSMTLNNLPSTTSAEYLINTKSLKEIVTEVIQSKQEIRDEKLKNDVEQILSQVDTTTGEEPLRCHSNNGKIIDLNNDDNQNANMKSLGALMIWNNQKKFPNQPMKIGEVLEVGDSNRKKTINTVTKYKLTKVSENIAYFTYEETSKFIKEYNKMNAKGKTEVEGKLEYDLSNNFFRLMTRVETSNFSSKFKSPDEKKMKSIDEKISMNNESTIKITLER